MKRIHITVDEGASSRSRHRRALRFFKLCLKQREACRAALLCAVLFVLQSAFLVMSIGMGAGAPPNHHQVLNSSDSQAISIVTRASSQSTFCVPQGGPLPVLTPSGKRANRIAREFDPPAQKWLAGHRGIDIDAPAHSKVLAPVNGTVKFVGKVAGKSEVSFSAFSDDTVIFSFEPAQTRLHVGDSLTKGEPLATVQGESDHCADTCVHWGARRNGVYVDPRTALDPVRIILKPVE